MSASTPKLMDPSDHQPEHSAPTKLGATSLAKDVVTKETSEDLMRSIIQMLNFQLPDRLDPLIGAKIILEADFNGVHYALICSPTRPIHHLSPREQEIAQLVAQGLPNKCISEILEISSWTVSTHLRRMFAKLGVTSRAAMVARMLEGVD